jgi:molybdopterin synthase catalytic subunit
MFRITEDEIRPQNVIKAVEHPAAGAIVTFLGTVRDRSRGKRVLYLEYDAYPGMAEKTLRQIGEEIRERWGLDRVAIVHRVGRLEIGEAIVAIAVAAPHRAEAFEACRYAIDRLKEIVPIWKKEAWEGGEYWVEDNRLKEEEQMPPVITATKPLREAFGDEVADSLVGLFDEFGEKTREDTVSLVEERFARRLAEEMSTLRVELKDDIAGLRVEIANARADMIRWMFIFWVGQLASILGILFVFFK